MFSNMKEFIKENKSKLLLVTLIILSLIFYYVYTEGNETTGKNNIIEIKEEAFEEKKINDTIIVHISGEVHSPGIAELHRGQRLYEALELVGGPTEYADLDKVNLALILEDQQKIVIPKINEDENRIDPQEEKININTANQQELMTLPGIGPTIAQNILDYREENNGFTNIEQIKEVPRVGEATFEKLKDKITCY